MADIVEGCTRSIHVEVSPFGYFWIVLSCCRGLFIVVDFVLICGLVVFLLMFLLLLNCFDDFRFVLVFDCFRLALGYCLIWCGCL